MQGPATSRPPPDFVATHPLDPEDGAIAAALRAMVSVAKGAPSGAEALDSPASVICPRSGACPRQPQGCV